MTMAGLLHKDSTEIIRCQSNCFWIVASILILCRGEAIAQNTIGDAPNNQGIITQGQHGNNYLGQLPRHLSAKDKAELIANIPRGRPIEIWFEASDPDTVDYASEIKTLLSGDLRTISRFQGAMLFIPGGVPRGVNVDLNKDTIKITVGIR